MRQFTFDVLLDLLLVVTDGGHRKGMGYTRCDRRCHGHFCGSFILRFYLMVLFYCLFSALHRELWGSDGGVGAISGGNTGVKLFFSGSSLLNGCLQF